MMYGCLISDKACIPSFYIQYGSKLGKKNLWKWEKICLNYLCYSHNCSHFKNKKTLSWWDTAFKLILPVTIPYSFSVLRPLVTFWVWCLFACNFYPEFNQQCFLLSQWCRKSSTLHLYGCLNWVLAFAALVPVITRWMQKQSACLEIWHVSEQHILSWGRCRRYLSLQLPPVIPSSLERGKEIYTPVAKWWEEWTMICTFWVFLCLFIKKMHSAFQWGICNWFFGRGPSFKACSCLGFIWYTGKILLIKYTGKDKGI